MNAFNRLREYVHEGWKITLDPSMQIPPSCTECPAFKAVDVHNQHRSGRKMRLRMYLANQH